MDLRGILNDSGPPAPASCINKRPPSQQMPSTPVQTAPPSQAFRDYSAASQPSPTRQASHEYPPPSYHSGAPYSRPPPPPPPLHPPPPNDMRSPSTASASAPSPYHQTSMSSMGAAGTSCPFSAMQQHTQHASPVVHHQQYPPATAYSRNPRDPRDPRESRDNYSQPGPHGALVHHAPAGSVSYPPGTPVPQTPPNGTPGGANAYIPRRSLSFHSATTPGSAHSQAPHSASYPLGSTVAAPQPYPPTSTDCYSRRGSQPLTPLAAHPPTPLGPPLASRQTSATIAQPSSPYQHRRSIASLQHPQVQIPPSQPQPPLAHRPQSYDTYSGDLHRLSRLHSDRERSLSVSPKTRIPSFHSSSGLPATSTSDSDSRPIQPTPMSTIPLLIDVERESAMTPAKRKLRDRDLTPAELERREARPSPFEGVNGGSHVHSRTAPPLPMNQSILPGSTMSPAAVMKRKTRPRLEKPIWAEEYRQQALKNANFVLHKPTNDHMANANGGRETSAKRDDSSRPVSPEEKRSVPHGHSPHDAPVSHRAISEPTQHVLALPNVRAPLGPWEPSLTGQRPSEDLTKQVADFFFLAVVSHPDMGEIQSRGVDFEIEAKLGMIIDKTTNDRISLPVMSECLLHNQGGRLGFRSTMTEAQHRDFNEYLNELTKEVHVNNSMSGKPPRVLINYKHRRERDTFYELTPEARERILPVCIQNLIPPRHGAKVRVTYDQRTNEVTAKILKARVADINIHFPQHLLDCRISVNLEMPWAGTVEELEEIQASSKRERLPDRNKDRLSYTHSHYRVDLTQVTQAVPGPNKTQHLDKEHELEIEVAPPVLIDQGKRAVEGKASQFPELVEGLLDNVRLLARRAVQ